MKLLRTLPVLFWAALLFFLSSQSKLPEPPVSFEQIDKLEHATAYGVFALLSLLALGWPRDRRVWLAALFAAVYGVSDECHQLFVPGRNADPWDVFADVCGALFTVSIYRGVIRRRKDFG